ncbi:MAG: ComF family protein [Clostridiaceae bacterium]|nr:ComF family protein [Clostridiaceae bacterium]
MSHVSYFSVCYHVCSSCLTMLPFKPYSEQIAHCIQHDDSLNPILAITAMRYEEPIASALRTLKFREGIYYAPILSFMMYKALQSTALTFDAVVPVPLSKQRLLMRGYNQAEILAEPISRRLDIPMLSQSLCRPRNTNQQSRFRDPLRRAQNITGAFEVPEDQCVDELRILLVDDVLTTGYTLHEAASTLLKSGASCVVALTAASRRIL